MNSLKYGGNTDNNGMGTASEIHRYSLDAGVRKVQNVYCCQ